MKHLITLTIFLFSASIIATGVPKYLKGAKVTVTLKNGKQYTRPSKEVAVVERKKMKRSSKVTTKKARRVINQNKKNRIYVLGGVGNNGKLKTKTIGNKYKTQIEQGIIFGIGFQRKIDNGDYSVGIQVQNNGTSSLTLGYDF